jgi:N-acetylglucosamine-6-phosphate deacetylase
MRLRSERVVGAAGVLAGEVVVHRGVIVDVVPGASGGSAGDVVELGDRWLVPGFIDTHVHGGGGAQCNTSDPDQVAAVARFHAAHGTTALLATTVSAPVDELVASLGAIRRASEARPGAGARVLGAHLEGPFLSPSRPGAMDRATFLAPESAVLRRLLDAGGGRVRMMTLAPELPGALELIRALVDAGAVPSLGHSDASYEQARAAVAAGARSVTHVFNAMPALHHRSPGLLGAALDLPDLSGELICDGEHVSAPVMRLLWRAKGRDGMRLVTDAIEAAGMPDGQYHLGAGRVRVSGGRATVKVGSSGESLAGSTLTMDAAVAGAVRWLGLELPEAVALASLNPARLLGLDDRLGTIAAGMDADLAVLDDQLRACGTLVGGEWVCGPPPLGPAT